jgi:hypothetical protein
MPQIRDSAQAEAEEDQAPEPNVSDMPLQPNEDGPHDVPDEQVIEKTLPADPGSVTT